MFTSPTNVSQWSVSEKASLWVISLGASWKDDAGSFSMESYRRHSRWEPVGAVVSLETNCWRQRTVGRCSIDVSRWDYLAGSGLLSIYGKESLARTDTQRASQGSVTGERLTESVSASVWKGGSHRERLWGEGYL